LNTDENNPDKIKIFTFKTTPPSSRGPSYVPRESVCAWVSVRYSLLNWLRGLWAK
jgi:hypothetical protein